MTLWSAYYRTKWPGRSINESLVRSLSAKSVYITDNRSQEYSFLSEDWLVSNPEGYALWFESRMALEQPLGHTIRARVDSLPTYRRKGVLQRSVQLLKRHRDVMFQAEPDRKPISMIITTLAALSYNGESTLGNAIQGILDRLGGFVRGSTPRVPNPTNPKEDFADRWGMPRYSHLRLEANFWAWLAQARKDFRIIGEQDVNASVRHLWDSFELKINPSVLLPVLNSEVAGSSATQNTHTISEPPRPWSRR